MKERGLAFNKDVGIESPRGIEMDSKNFNGG